MISSKEKMISSKEKMIINFKISWIRLLSIPLSSDTRKASSVNIFRSGWEHFAEYSEVLDIVELSSTGEH